MNDDLDNKTDAELNELFLREVAGWFPEPNNRSYWRTHWPRENDGFKGYIGKEPSHVPARNLPDCCTDANAVLPWLLRNFCEIRNNPGGGWTVRVWAYVHGEVFVREGESAAPYQPFARAAVIALIRAKRWSI